MICARTNTFPTPKYTGTSLIVWRTEKHKGDSETMEMEVPRGRPGKNGRVKKYENNKSPRWVRLRGVWRLSESFTSIAVSHVFSHLSLSLLLCFCLVSNSLSTLPPIQRYSGTIARSDLFCFLFSPETISNDDLTDGKIPKSSTRCQKLPFTSG